MKPLHEREADGDLNAAEWQEVLAKPIGRRPWHNDREACAAAETTVRTLQTLQTEGVIASTKALKPYGGFRRVWRSDAVYIAAVAAEICRVWDWSVAKAAAVLRLLKGKEDLLICDSKFGPDADPSVANLVQRQDDDWFLSIHDGKFVFLKVPEKTRPAFNALGREFPIGVLSRETFVPTSYQLEDGGVFEGVAKKVGRTEADRLLHEVQTCRAAFGNSRAGAWIDISMPIRAASRRVGGHEARYIDDVAMDVLQAIRRESSKGGDR